MIIGLDLGTSNCALAFVDPAGGERAAVRDFPVVQLVRPGEAGARPLLPSCVYLPSPHELPERALALPWGGPADPPRVVGELARWQGARVPSRLVSSAKSWLCHPGVDRQAPILPWGAPAEVHKLTPVQASALLLAHLSNAFTAAFPQTPLPEQEVVLTVPASFDEAARALTVSAARQAGLGHFVLLEEPQAAFYDFTSRHRSDLSRALAGVRLVLVVDVGGGTTDFTLVQVEALPEGPALRRIAVGEHLMLGGDNMDAALANLLEEKLAGTGGRFAASQWIQLLQAARLAKETLLSPMAPERTAVSIAGSGSKLVGATLAAELTRAEVEAVVARGFFPRTAPDEPPRRGSRAALKELGLPYAQDPAITRHLADFLRAHSEAARQALGGAAATEGLNRPDAILLNGGVFNSPALCDALVEAVSGFWPSSPRIPLLAHDSLDLAVARGAACYGLARRGLGKKIGGGAARAYFVGVAGGERRGVCLIPRGFEEGQSVDLAAQSFTLTLGRPVHFQLYSTTADRVDRPGEVVELSGEAFRPLPPIHTLLKGADPRSAAASVHLAATLTEIGTLELFCHAAATIERWRLEFELRGDKASTALTVTESMPARFAEASEQIHRVFGHKPLPVGPKDVKQLGRSLEKVLGPREGWRLPVLRELWSALVAGAAKRRRSADHERVFFHLLGYSLRPGFGYPLDAWRCEQTARLFSELVQNHSEKAVWIEFWVMWRRVAGGLSVEPQRRIWEYLRPHLARRVPPEASKAKERLRGPQPEGLDEMIRAAASLEHLEPAEKAELGGWIAARLRASPESGGPWAWALGRLGARAPIYGSGHRTVEPELAGSWVALLLELGLTKVEGAPFALAQLARLTGDRSRDLDDELRASAMAALGRAGAPEEWTRMLREVVELSEADEARALSDTVPPGLALR
ncbi:MAG: hsp70 family protein [Myxococcales bacterium]|nr:hsp70 family protein [Myxococcales bacterium]